MTHRFHSHKPSQLHSKQHHQNTLSLNAGPYIGKIKNNLDATRSSRVQVWIPDLGGSEADPQNWRTVSYASPFMGYTYQADNSGSGSGSDQYDKVRHAYGMWMATPDVGNLVLITFVGGDPHRGFWFACIPEHLGHYMIPSIAAGPNVDTGNLLDKTLQKQIGPTSSVPVVEFNEENNSQKDYSRFGSYPKSPHEWQWVGLVDQGLDRDAIRGANSSSSQRETPSRVFGISTPGRPLNDPFQDPAFVEKFRQNQSDTSVLDAAVSVRGRTGGHTFVMDDGDAQGVDQGIRLKTSFGHQILLSDEHDIIYIINNTGTAWVEINGDGAIRVYSKDTFDLRSQGDINIHTDKDMNIHVGGTMNVHANTKIHMQTDVLETHTTSGTYINSEKDMHLKTSTVFHLQASKDGHIKTGAGLNLEAAAATNFKAGSTANFQSGGAMQLDGSHIGLNDGGKAGPAAAADPVTPIKPTDFPDAEQDANNLWQHTATVSSIAKVVPAHEPYVRDYATKTGSTTLKQVAADATANPDIPPPAVTNTR